MTTYVNFTPSQTTNFQFNLALDGMNYIAICTYNNYSTRYYISIYDNFNNLACSLPVIASPDEYSINIVKGFFTTSTLVYRQSSSNFEISP